jgi:hypothetical protein
MVKYTKGANIQFEAVDSLHRRPLVVLDICNDYMKERLGKRSNGSLRHHDHLCNWSGRMPMARKGKEAEAMDPLEDGFSLLGM